VEGGSGGNGNGGDEAELAELVGGYLFVAANDANSSRAATVTISGLPKSKFSEDNAVDDGGGELQPLRTVEVWTPFFQYFQTKIDTTNEHFPKTGSGH
jgi:hypothetical protein